MPSKALLIIDFEKEWADRTSDYHVGDLSSVLARTNKLIDFCRSSGYKIIFTRHIDKGAESAFVEGSENVDLIARLHKKDSDIIITKYKVSCFYQTSLEKELYGIKEIVIAGILTNQCVRLAIEEAYDRDFVITAVKDCCVAFDEETQEFTFSDLKKTREEIKFINVSEFIKKK